MLDPHLLRTNLDDVIYRLRKRGDIGINISRLRELESRRKQLQVETEKLQHHRNSLSKEIGEAMRAGQDIQILKDEVVSISNSLKSYEDNLKKVQLDLEEILLTIPNIPHESVPEGTSEADNKEIHKWGKLPEFDFAPPKDHVDLGAALGLIDFESATRITASRFVVMSGTIARLHRALIQFMLDVHTQEHGYTEVNVPYIVNADSVRNTGQLPKFEQDLFKILRTKFSMKEAAREAALKGENYPGAPYDVNEEYWYLIPTAEVPVTNLARDQIIPAEKMPLKYVCHTPCFRSEAGSYGKDTRGMIRQHQFEKVELVQLVKPEDSYKALEELTVHAEVILQKLKLPYRVVALCGADLGFSSAKTYDLEVWLPGQQKYREISSCSNFEDFQARRMQARWRNPATGKPELLHTLNGSGLAVGRTLIAIMENYQNHDGTIRIPEVLKKYMDGMEIIK